VEEELLPLAPHETFAFECSAQRPCFNACCRDLNQFLSPYDVLRLKNHLGLSSGDFLARFTTSHDGPATGLPVVCFKLDHAQKWACPFVSAAGCTVYEHRPSSCRTYPLARTVARDRATGQIRVYHYLLEEPHCEGFSHGRQWTAEQWLEDQRAGPYLEANDWFLDIIALKSQKGPGALDLAQRHLVFTALYDLDNFRRQIFEEGLLMRLGPPGRFLDTIRLDDLALLQFGHSWVKAKVFGQPLVFP
jgi:hypothetical protein